MGESNANFERVQLGPVLPVLKRRLKKSVDKKGQSVCERIPPSPEMAKRNQERRRLAIGQFNKWENEFKESKRNGKIEKRAEMSEVEWFQRPKWPHSAFASTCNPSNLTLTNRLCRLSIENSEGELDIANLVDFEQWQKEQIAALLALVERKTRGKRVRRAKFREPCWRLPPAHTKEIATLLFALHSHTEIFTKDVKAMFPMEFEAAVSNQELDSAIGCPWKYSGVQKFIDVIHTLTHIMTSGCTYLHVFYFLFHSRI